MGGAWLGSALFFPLILVFLCCWIASKVLGPEYEHMKVAIGIVSAQAIMHVLGGLYFGPEVLLSVLPDVVVLGGGVAWLIARPGVWPVALLLAFEAFAMAFDHRRHRPDRLRGRDPEGRDQLLLIRAAAIIFLYRSVASPARQAGSGTRDCRASQLSQNAGAACSRLGPILNAEQRRASPVLSSMSTARPDSVAASSSPPTCCSRRR